MSAKLKISLGESEIEVEGDPAFVKDVSEQFFKLMNKKADLLEKREEREANENREA